MRLPERKWVFLTLSMEDLLGMSIPEFMVRFNLNLVIHPEDQHLFDELLRLAQEEGSGSVDLRFCGMDDSCKWVNLRAVGHRDESGVCKYVVGVARDISEVRRYQEELKLSEMRWKAVLDNAGEAFLTVDQSGNVTYVNKSFESMLGYRRDQIEGRSLWTLVPDDQRQVLDYQWSMRHVKWQRRYEIDLLRSDGSRMPARVIATVVKDLGEDQYLHFGFIDDLTQIRRIDREQKDRLRFLRTLLDTIPSPVFYKDSRGRYQGFNRAFQEVFQAIGPMGEFDMSYLPDDFVARDVNSDLDLLRNPGAMCFHFKFGEGDVSRHFVVHKATFFDHVGRVGGFVGVMTEITEQKRMEAELREAKERAEASSRAKMAFVSHISHEIRTPMNAVVGLSEMLLDSCEDPEIREDLELIHQASMSLTEILGDILDLAAVEAGKLRLEESSFSMEDLCAPVFSLMGAEAKRKGLEFRGKVEDGASGHFVGDQVRIRQLLWNLLSNAIKFTPSGSVSARISASEGGVLFEVSDTGVGIEEEQLDRIFDYFERGEELLTRRIPGTGLGLALCKKLVSLMGGAIRVRSRGGEGSCFSIWLPLRRDHGLASPDRGDDAPELPRGLRVLLAEDNRANQRLMMSLLERMGLSVRCASDGAEALRALEEETFDMVFMDVQMPAMDGLEVTRRFREMERGTGRRTLIIGLTAFSSPDDRRACVEAGMDRFLAKPVSPSRLRREMGRIWSFTSNERNLVNLDVLMEMADGSRELAVGFATDVLEMLPGHIQCLSQAAAGESDPAAVEKSLHRLKGSAGYLGAASLEADLAGLLERWRGGDRQQVIQDLPALLEKLRTLQEELKGYVGG
jgi:PAS domain S-box-containing protein